MKGVHRLHFNNGTFAYCDRLHSEQEVECFEDCMCEDIKTSLANTRPVIPAGTVLQIQDVLCNFYGTFVLVRFEGFTYCLNPRKLDWSIPNDTNYKHCTA